MSETGIPLFNGDRVFIDPWAGIIRIIRVRRAAWWRRVWEWVRSEKARLRREAAERSVA